MGFRDRHNDFSGGLLKRFSYKSKIIIFCILSVIVFVIAYKEAINNRTNGKRIIEKANNTNTNFQTVIKADDQGRGKEEKLKEEQNKKLEDKYQESSKLFGDKKYQDTINIADSIINEDPNFYKAYNIKGIALCYSNNYDEGMKNIDKALELKSDFGYARFNKALAYELYGYYDEALQWYDKDLEVENYVWSYYGKASIYGRRNDVENTVKYLKTAVNMSPDIKKIASEEEDFNSVKDSKEFQDLIK